MSDNSKKDQAVASQENDNTAKQENDQKDTKDQSLEEKLKESEDKLLRSLAEIENQRRRFEKEIKDAFEFGSFNFAKESLAILDNLERAKNAIRNDEVLKSNKDLDNLKIFPVNVGQDNVKKAKKFFDDLNIKNLDLYFDENINCLLYTSPSPRDNPASRMPSSA